MTEDSRQRMQPEEATEPPRKAAPVIAFKRLRRELRSKIDAELDALAGGEFTIDDSRAAIKRALRKVNLNDYADDIALRVEAAERHQRQSSFSTAIARALESQDMFSEELARRVWIPLGDGKEVTLADATHVHIHHKRQEQRLAVEKDMQAIANTDQFEHMLGRDFLSDPTVTVTIAQRRLGRWPEGGAAASDETA